VTKLDYVGHQALSFVPGPSLKLAMSLSGRGNSISGTARIDPFQVRPDYETTAEMRPILKNHFKTRTHKTASKQCEVSICASFRYSLFTGADLPYISLDPDTRRTVSVSE
jgi:hypothetical protein